MVTLLTNPLNSLLDSALIVVILASFDSPPAAGSSYTFTRFVSSFNLANFSSSNLLTSNALRILSIAKTSRSRVRTIAIIKSGVTINNMAPIYAPINVRGIITFVMP